MTPGGVPPEVETIVAIATPHGSGAIGVIRLSGPRALALADRVLIDPRGRKLSDIPPRHLHRVTVIDPRDGARLDEALVVSMPGPGSYTGEDVVEISCHGNPVLLGSLVERLCEAGARLAAPGEFTRRAYVNGRMSLLEAEAVAGIIAARSERALQLAARELKHGIEGKVTAVRERLLDLVAGLEVALDFPDEGVGTSDADAAKAAEEISREVAALIQGARKARAIQDGLTVMLVGAPNVGKSSLLNALLGAERAIVSATSGTTRDVVEGRLTVRGVPITLRDGAGLGEPRDALDAEAMRRTRIALDSSDLVVVVLDHSRPLEGADEEVLAATRGMERIVGANKSDLPAGGTSDAVWDYRSSALTVAGLAELSARLEQWVGRRIGLDSEEGGFVASIRVSEALGDVEASLHRAAGALAHVPVEAVLVDLRHALGALDSILGVGAEDALLDRVFSTFCVGK